MKWWLIIIGLFWEDSPHPCSSLPVISSLLSLFSLFFVFTHAVIHVNCCYCCVLVTNQVRVRMTKTYKTFCNELFKGL